MSKDSHRTRDRRLLDEPAGVFVRSQQTFDFRPHACLVATRGVQKGRALRGLALERGVEEFFYARPTTHLGAQSIST